MNNLDIAGLLKTYSEKCLRARNAEHLKEIVRDLKSVLNAREIMKLRMTNN
jgi:hypothetical protein